MPARGTLADLGASIDDIEHGEIVFATDQTQYYQKDIDQLIPVGASKAQGTKADTALQVGSPISSLQNDSDYITLKDVLTSELAGAYSRRNWLVNGNFYWWTRARNLLIDVAGSHHVYDHWSFSMEGTADIRIDRPIAVGTGIPVIGRPLFTSRIVQDTGTATHLSMSQRVGGTSLVTLAGSSVTVTFWIWQPAGTADVTVDLEQYFGPASTTQTKVFNLGVITGHAGGWIKFEGTVFLDDLIGTDIQSGAGLFLRLSYEPQLNSIIEISNVQLELGSYGTPYANQPTYDTVQDIEYYFQKSGNPYDEPGSEDSGSVIMQSGALGHCVHHVDFRNYMATVPTVTIYP